jgi:hypothetical protein
LSLASLTPETHGVRMTDRQGAWMTLAIGFLGLVLAALGILASATGAGVSGSIMAALGGAVGGVFIKRGLRQLRV